MSIPSRASSWYSRYLVCLLSVLVVHVPSLVDAVGLPSAARFDRLYVHASANLGDYVYLDGGEIREGDDFNVRQNTATIAIDMRTSWTNTTVRLLTTEKDASLKIPSLKDAALWAHPDKKSFYLVGGQLSEWISTAYVPDSVSLWRFTIDGAGSGAWAAVPAPSPANDTTTTPNSDPMPPLRRQAGGIAAVDSQTGTGYLLGGFQSGFTEQQFVNATSAVPIPGIVSYNMASGSWHNDSSAGYSPTGNAIFGKGFVMSGQQGKLATEDLLVFLGGYTPNPVTFQGNASELVSMGGVTLYEPKGKRWYQQKTTGIGPTPRAAFCAVGVSSLGGTYEIFVYGGTDFETQQTHGDIYVLSIPAFHWTRLKDAPPRRFMTCDVVGKGQSQMLVVGGDVTDSRTRDSNVYGLGIYDLTALTWSSRYDVEAAVYDSALVVKDAYLDATPNSTIFTTPDLNSLFPYINRTEWAKTPPPARPSPSDNTSPTSTSLPIPSSPSSSSKSPSTALIAGTVTGTTLLLALLLLSCAVSWRAYKKRQQRRRQKRQDQQRKDIDAAIAVKQQQQQEMQQQQAMQQQQQQHGRSLFTSELQDSPTTDHNNSPSQGRDRQGPFASEVSSEDIKELDAVGTAGAGELETRDEVVEMGTGRQARGMRTPVMVGTGERAELAGSAV